MLHLEGMCDVYKAWVRVADEVSPAASPEASPFLSLSDEHILCAIQRGWAWAGLVPAWKAGRECRQARVTVPPCSLWNKLMIVSSYLAYTRCIR